MLTIHTRVAQGFLSGLKQRHKGFLTLLSICLGLVPVLLGVTMLATREPLSSAFIAELGPVFWISLAFSGYLAVIACLQQYHRDRGEPIQFVRLATQVDVVVSAGLFALLVSLLL